MAASRASPMSDALELCARYTSAGDMEALLPELTGIIRRGVGLNTKVGRGPDCTGWLAGWLAGCAAAVCVPGPRCVPGPCCVPVHGCPCTSTPRFLGLACLCCCLAHPSSPNPPHPTPTSTPTRTCMVLNRYLPRAPAPRWAWPASSAPWPPSCSATSRPRPQGC